MLCFPLLKADDISSLWPAGPAYFITFKLEPSFSLKFTVFKLESYTGREVAIVIDRYEPF